MDWIGSTLNDPAKLHAAAVHVPIALALLSIIPAIGLIATRGSSKAWRIATLVVFAIVLASSFVAVKSGESAEGQSGDLPHAVREQRHEHEEMGEKVWMFALAGLICCGVTLAGRPAARWTGAGLTVVASASLGGWIAYAAHLGGDMVYTYGVGTPKPITGAEYVVLESGGSLSSLEERGDPRVEFFVQMVRPILARHCMGCHDETDHEAGLILTTGAGVWAGGESGPAVVPGDPEQSLIYTSVSWTDPVLRMPNKKPKLPDEDIEAIKKWIEDGAVWAE